MPASLQGQKRATHGPSSCLSLQPGGKLIIPTSDGPVVIELGTGDAVLFRYDVRHGGAAYASQHIRLHE